MDVDRLTKGGPPPPPVNLADVGQIIQKMTNFVGQRMEVVIGDYRHWFHQIQAPTELQRLFGLKVGAQIYRWLMLPMGWGWSPYFAQVCAWATLAFRTKEEESILMEECFKEGELLPTFVRTRCGGFVTVYYDNFIVVTPSPREADDLHKRWRVNATPERTGAVIKTGSLHRFTHREIAATGFDFLGLHLQTEVDALDKNRVSSLSWHPCKLQRWSEKFPPDFSPRRRVKLQSGSDGWCSVVRWLMHLSEEY